MGPLEFRVLGPTEVLRDGVPLRFRGNRERVLVALLVLHANRVVSSERLIEDLWSGEVPEGALRTLRVYVSRVRQTLGDTGDLLATRPAGYLLRAEPETVDALRFEALVSSGREQARAGDHQGALATFREALALWRGPALAEVANAPLAQAEAIRLEEARLVALEDRLDAELMCGRHGEVVAELEALTRAHPFRERLWAQLMTALYRAGRQTEALRAYQEIRRMLGEQLGIEPGSDLRRLESAILRQEPELAWEPGPPASNGGVVTFLFTDVVGSTERLAHLGETAAEEARQAHFGMLRAAVAAHHGTEIKNLGDGLMVAFGSPLAAVGCAVAMRQAVARQDQPHSKSLGIRIGLHAGEPMRDEGDFFGTAVVIAKRLCDRAEGGQILASGLVRELVGRRGEETFTFRFLGGLALKGLAEPVATCEVIWASPAHEPSDEMTGLLPLPRPLSREERLPLVGRAGELARLEEAWAAARSGERQLVLLAGEPGIGKTRLTADFCRQVHSEGATVLFGRCDEGMGVPYQPFVEALGRYLNDSSVPVLGRMAGELARLVPEVGERVQGLPLPPRSDPETERYRLFDAVATWLGALSSNRPLLFVLDDLHWATKPTLLLLSHLVRSGEAAPLLLLATYRDSELDMTIDLADILSELRRLPGVERVRLSGLDEAAVGALMEAQARHQLDDEGRALARRLHAETAGNPFFVREVLRHLIEKGIVVRRGGRWTAAAQATDVDVPDSVREVLGRRLTRLPDRTDAMLAVAAVLGERFELSVLAEAARDTHAAVLTDLTPAVAARLIEETTIGGYHFSHALVRSTLLDALGPTRRAQLHLQAAEALESVYAGRLEGRAAVLAAHYQQAGALAPPERVVDALIEAGEEAAAARAWEQVAGHWQAAMDLMERTCADRAKQADLLTRLADLLYVTGFDLSASIAYAERAIELFANLGDDKRVTILRSRLGGYLTSNPVYGVMDVRRGLELFDQAEKSLQRQPESVAYYGYLLGTVSAATGIWAARPEDALRTAPRAIEIARRHGHEPLTVVGQMLHGFALVGVGSIAEGLALIEQGWESADRLDHRILGMRTTHIRAAWALVLREPDVAIHRIERELSKPRLAQVPIQRQLLQGQLAWAYGLVGRLAEAEQVLDEAGGLPIGGSFGPPLELWRGSWPAAETALRQWTDRYREMGNRFDEAVVIASTAEACRLQGDLDGAEASLEHALAIVVPAHHRVLEAGFRIDLGILNVGRRRTDDARRHLDRARALMAAGDWRGLHGRLLLAEAALEAEHELSRAGGLFERAIQALRRSMLAWDEAEALLLWGRAVRVAEPAVAGEKVAAATEIYRRCGAGESWLKRAEALGGADEPNQRALDRLDG